MINLKKFEEIAHGLAPQFRKTQRCFHCAGIYDKRDRLISIGYNQAKTHSAIKKYNYYSVARLHAELSCALRGGKDDYSNHTMVVLRINKNNALDYSRPCAGCMDLCRKIGIENCFYTDNVGQWIVINPFEEKSENKPDRY